MGGGDVLHEEFGGDLHTTHTDVPKEGVKVAGERGALLVLEEAVDCTVQ